MDVLRRAGGIAALVQALAYVAGFALFIGVLDASAYVGPARKMAFLVEHQTAMTGAAILVYIVTGIALVVLSLALHARLAPRAPALMPVATAFGLIWAGLILASGMILLGGIAAVIDLQSSDIPAAAALWRSIIVVQDALGGDIELVGGIWVALVSVAGLCTATLPAAIGWAGIAIGIVGIVTIVPALGDLVDVFGIGQILWFTAIGVVLVRGGDRKIARH